MNSKHIKLNNGTKALLIFEFICVCVFVNLGTAKCVPLIIGLSYLDKNEHAIAVDFGGMLV